LRLVGLVAEARLRESGLLVDVVGDQTTEVSAIVMDSRRVVPGALFACVPGQYRDGHGFASAAVGGGAAALLTERPVDVAAPQVVVSSVRQAVGPMADALLDHPSRDLVVAGVTGTNGKTTTCAFLEGALQSNGWPTATIGTLTQQRTTPEAAELQERLADWRAGGGRAVAMEVSSHALIQHRVDAIHFAAGVFTNLTPEHLDFHRSMDEYFEAKAMLFHPERIEVAVINRADPWGQRLINRLERTPVPVETFAPDDALDIELSPTEARFAWGGQRMAIRLGGRFNVTNAVAAAACARALGVPVDAIAAGLGDVQGVRGRFEPVDEGQPFTVLVDYAHTPDGLTQALQGAREVAEGRLLVVFGAGGDRDHDKRPLMGEAAARLADLAVVTSDNPRSENPDEIIRQVVAGSRGASNFVIEPDRTAAIFHALSGATAGDVVLIAGKGHEPKQEVAGRVLPFDDAETARLALRRILGTGGAGP
jgi:UDP-N-acetylmuramoyl-L-alanyl-D-glutamate--2,6-diaminopimelate ligase